MNLSERAYVRMCMALLITIVAMLAVFGDEWLAVTVTAYSPGMQNDGVRSNDVTATGVPTTFRGIAADYKQFPIGTTITIPGYGTAKVDDACGAARSAHRAGKVPLIDIRFPTVELARAWGRQHLRVRVVTP